MENDKPCCAQARAEGIKEGIFQESQKETFIRHEASQIALHLAYEQCAKIAEKECADCKCGKIQCEVAQQIAEEIRQSTKELDK